MGKLSSAYNALIEFSGAAPGFMVAVIALGITADVLLRNLGFGGIGWMLEAVEYGLYVLTFTGAAYALNRSRHVTIDFFANNLPWPMRRALSIFAITVVLLVCLVLTAYSALTVWTAFVDQSMIFKSFTIPEWVPLAYLLPTMVLLTIEALCRLRSAWSEKEAGPSSAGSGDPA